MTQTLMDFIALVSRVPSPSPAPADVASCPLHLAKQRFDTRLAILNRKIASFAPGGRLIGVPLCPTACKPGKLADFVLSIGTDPFRRWNMVLYADSPATARTLRTVPYHAEYAFAVDPIMVDYLMRLRRLRTNRLRMADGKCDLLAGIDRKLRDQLFADCQRIEAKLFRQGERPWRLQSEGAIAEGSPPRAAISAVMSAGIGAENRIS